QTPRAPHAGAGRTSGAAPGQAPPAGDPLPPLPPAGDGGSAPGGSGGPATPSGGDPPPGDGPGQTTARLGWGVVPTLESPGDPNAAGDLARMAPGVVAGMPSLFSGNPVRYFDGVVKLS